MNKIIITLAVFAFVAFSFTNKQEAYKIGDKVEDFKLLGTDDAMHSMSDYPNANGFIIIFTCNHCPYSKAYEDRINALYDKYDTMGYHVIAINPNDPVLYESDNFDNMKIRAKEKGFKFPYLVDEGQKLFPKFGATKTPHTYVLDKNKILKYVGAIDDATDEEKDLACWRKKTRI